jgi:hypothetical protein
MRRAYEADPEELQAHLDDFVVAVFADLTSSFLVMPKGPSFVEYPRFRERGKPAFEVIACIDGRGFGVRAEDMRQLLVRTNGKVFTLANLDDLIQHTGLAAFLPE